MGIVTGLLNADGTIDTERCAKIIAMASPIPVAFHRAFDMSNNLSKSLEAIIQLGFVRILTSGGKENAFVGANEIAKLVLQANRRIEIMPGAGITAENIADIARITGARSFHTTAKTRVASKMQFKNEASKMVGKDADESSYEETDMNKVKVLREILNKL